MRDVIEQFRTAIHNAGLQPPEVIYADGKVHRFSTNGKPNDNAGWYVFYDDGIPAGAFGCWRAGISETWRADFGRPLTPAEEAEHRKKIDALKRERDADEVQRRAAVKQTASMIWEESQPAPQDHPYLARKHVKPNGARIYDGALVVPLRDAAGELQSLQFISSDGNKRFLTGGWVGGCYFAIGDRKDGGPLCIAEGFATAASIYESTGLPVAVTFYAGNLKAVAKALHDKCPSLQLIICGDDDAGTEGNPGLTKAREAAQAVGGKVVVPDFGADRPDRATDFNDLLLLRGAETVKAQIGAAIGAGHRDRSTISDKKKSESQADLMIKFVRESGAELFHTATAETFISFPVNDHIETWPTNSQATRQWLRRGFYLITQKAPNAEALQSTIGLLDSLARFDGKTAAVHLRTAWHNGALYYDLCDSEWRAVRIDHNGWNIVAQPEVKFIRYSHMTAQVEPQAGGDLNWLFQFVNVHERHGRELIKSFLPVALIPDIPRPCLALHGDQGSGKTSAARRLRSLIDPSDMAMLRCKDDAETVQGLAHHYAPIIDNLSNLPEWLSDTLSRAVTGEGFTKRALYTNADDYLFSYKRVFILTGISLVITKPDLLDRSIIIPLERIPNDARRDERLLDEQFEAARPCLFGAMLDMLSGAIREYPNVLPGELPRMADFAKWAMAGARGQGRDPATFIADFKTNVERQNEEALGSSVVANVLLAFMTDCDEWTGPSHELYARLKQKAEDMKIPTKSFPGSSAAMGRRLREIRPNLAAIGWRMEFKPTPKERLITISRNNKKNAVTAVINQHDAHDSKDTNDGIPVFVSGADPWDEEGLV